MTFTVWLMVENDDDDDDDRDETWWSVDHFPTEEEALAYTTALAEQIYARTGVEPARLDQ